MPKKAELDRVPEAERNPSQPGLPTIEEMLASEDSKPVGFWSDQVFADRRSHTKFGFISLIVPHATHAGLKGQQTMQACYELLVKGRLPLHNDGYVKKQINREKKLDDKTPPITRFFKPIKSSQKMLGNDLTNDDDVQMLDDDLTDNLDDDVSAMCAYIKELDIKIQSAAEQEAMLVKQTKEMDKKEKSLVKQTKEMDKKKKRLDKMQQAVLAIFNENNIAIPDSLKAQLQEHLDRKRNAENDEHLNEEAGMKRQK